ncbi:PARP6, partial [Symbiodinium necroappetens]
MGNWEVALDLKAAYKQLARHPKDGWVSIVAVLNPDSGEVSYFEAVALPFGAVSAVTGFNRAARALRRILSILFSLALPFDRVFNMLGATISFERAAKGDVLVKNKPGRLEAIEEVVMQCMSERRCDRKRMLSIKGKLLFAAGHVFGRCAQLATQLISHRGNDRHPGREHMDDLLNALRFALETLKSGGPRCVGAWSQQPPVLIFTDGACEQEGNLVTHGALLFDPVTGRKEVFGDHVPKCLVERWKGGGKKQ